MDLKLKRFSYTSDGVFGLLLDAAADQVCFTLEHSYNNQPKLVNGIYTCIRGIHQLDNGKPSFETFEIMGVPLHTGILFHMGNTQSDSHGCVLLGTAIEKALLTQSSRAFDKFMAIEAEAKQFQLTVG